MSRHSFVRSILRIPRCRHLAGACVVLFLVIGCDAGPSLFPAESIPVEAPERRGGEAFLDRAEIVEVLEMQNLRDGAGLLEWLEHEDPGVRARAAFALASVRDPGSVEALRALLEDPAFEVRRDAAFALGHLRHDDDGRALLAALHDEQESSVRLQLIESLGLRGGGEVIGEMAAFSPAEGESGALYLALARMGLRAGPAAPDVLLERLIDGLSDDDVRAREGAAYYFGRQADAEVWADHVERVRTALDHYAPADPAAMHLLLGIGRLRDRDDAERLLEWMSGAEDWRIRVNAARAVGTTQLLETPGVRDALWERVEVDPYEHVGVAAAISLLSGFRVPNTVLERSRRWVGEGPDRWQTKIPFLEFLTEVGEPGPVLAWVEENRGHSDGLDRQLPLLLGQSAADDAMVRVREFAEHSDLPVRVAALSVLSERWEFGNPGPEVQEGFFDLFVRALREGHPYEAMKAAVGLSDPSFHAYGSVHEMEEGYRVRAGGDIEEERPVLVAILEGLAQIGDPASLPLVEEALESEDFRLRRAAGEALESMTGQEVRGLEIPDPQVDLDVEYLRQLGPNPRLVLETDRGTLRILLAPDEAPLTVQTIARYAEAGRYDGVIFHRVIGNFVAQSGDFSAGDGSGGPGLAIRSEMTRIPFRRGAIGMASSGRDTEQSQFFVTHSMQPHLDGSIDESGEWQAYTAFGWLEEGENALDQLMEGDRILSATVERDDGAES